MLKNSEYFIGIFVKMLLFLLMSFLSICYLTNGQLNESVIRETRPLSSSTFDEIEINGAFDIFLSRTTNKSSNSTVQIETNIDIQKNVIVEIIDHHILSIRLHGSFHLEKTINVYIRFSSPLRRYTVKGNGNTLTDDNGIINEDNRVFLVDHRGVGNLAIRLDVYKFEFYFTGTGNSRFWGQVRQQTLVNAKGVGDINAQNLLTRNADVLVTGISIVRVMATEDLQIQVTGISNVYYQLPQGKKPSKAISTGLGKIVPIS